MRYKIILSSLKIPSGNYCYFILIKLNKLYLYSWWSKIIWQIYKAKIWLLFFNKIYKYTRDGFSEAVNMSIKIFKIKIYNLINF